MEYKVGVVIGFLISLSGSTGTSGQPHGDLNTCPESWTRCNWTRLCIPSAMLCNGYDNCGDGEDEMHCATTSSVPTTTPTMPIQRTQTTSTPTQVTFPAMPIQTISTSAQATFPATPIQRTQITSTPTQASFPTISPEELACRGGRPLVLTADSGELQSPGYSLSTAAHYPGASQCAWRLQGPPHTLVVLHFEDFMLESSPNCSSDSLTVYNGADETGSVLGTFCGKYRPQDITSTQPQVFLQFFSDGGVEGRGFRITWISYTTLTTTRLSQTTPSPGSGCDGTAVLLTSPSGVVTSHGFDGASPYANNVDCQWHIMVAPGQVIELRFNSFDLEWTSGCSYDYVIIYDSTDYNIEQSRLCGDRPPPEFTSASNSMLIRMHSDEEVGGFGFNFTYTSHPSTGKCTPSEFSCPCGLCIPYDQVCNGHPDCPAGGDEIICANSECGQPAVTPQLEENRIVGGREAVEGSWPWQASLRMSGKHMCGATLIHPLWVLTAAHCFDSNWRTQDWSVMLGAHELRVPSSPHQQLINVSDILLRHDYDSITSDNDVALLKLARPAAMTIYVQLACLSAIVLPPGEICYVTGFGETLSTCCAGKLKQAAVPLIARERCNQADWYGGRVLSNMVCAGYKQGGTDACGGDSGGPLVCPAGRRWMLYGVTSWGVSCADAKRPGVYIRVADYVKWIQETVAKHP